MTDYERLTEVLRKQKITLKNSWPSNQFELIIETVRALDYIMFMLKSEFSVPDKDWLMAKYRFGWSLIFSIFYEEYQYKDQISAVLFDKEARKWLDNVIQHAGMVQTSSQLLAYCKADLMKIVQSDEYTFTFKYKVNDPVERYEKMSLDYFFRIVNVVHQDRIDEMVSQLPSIRKSLRDLVDVFNSNFISYKANAQIDGFYSEFADLYLQTTQVIDDFSESDFFGGVSYRQYLDFAQDLVMSAIMHRDCCMALAEKTNHEIHLRNILTHMFSKEAFLINYAQSRNLDKKIVSQIASCFTVNKTNFQNHLGYPGAPCPPLFELSDDLVMRSTHGCIDMPIFYLNRELKHRYKKDYFVAVNNREDRFRTQLYSLFPERLIKVERNVIISAGGHSTDIDAIIFDPERKVLALFQLKWQDSFSTSIRERFSRISNLIPKSVEWIEKVVAWIKITDMQKILEKIGLRSEEHVIKDFYLFVVSRNHVHFSNQVLDDRAVWASWYQIIEVFAKTKAPLHENPIQEFASSLRLFSPSRRREFERAQPTGSLAYRIANYNIFVEPIEKT